MRLPIALLACLATTAALAAPKPFATTADLGQWVANYYLRPDPSRSVQAVAAASELGLFAQGRASATFVGFLAGVLRREPSVAKDAVTRLAKLPKAEQPMVVLAVWYSGHPETKKLMGDLSRAMPDHKAMFDELSAQPAQRLEDLPLEQGTWVVDALWGSFMATGEEKPVVRIMSALPWAAIPGNGAKQVAGNAAKVSLTSNAVQHPRVLAISKAHVARQPKEVSAPLAEVILRAEEELRTRAAGGAKAAPAAKK
jgi:hypothetical protein